MKTSIQSFRFSGDLFYQEETVVPFRKGITLCRGINYDAGPSENNSNGTGKTRIPQILEAFIYNSSDRGHLKKMFLPNFKGALDFNNGSQWSFSFDLKENAWEITKDGVTYPTFHKPSECQAFLAEQIGKTHKEWGHFVYINRNSISVLLKGKPDQRRKHLESFFNIDEWYEEKRQEYIALKKQLEDDLHLMTQAQARLGQVLDSLSRLESAEYLSNQIDLLQKTITHIKIDQSTKVDAFRLVNEHLERWKDYYEICYQIEGKRPLSELQEDSSILRNTLAELQEKQKRKTIVEMKVKRELLPLEDALKSAYLPEMPTEPEPQASDIGALDAQLSKMHAKTKLAEKFKSVKASLPVLDTDESEEVLGERRKTLTSQLAEVFLHLSLVKDGKNCTNCGQSLEFILNNQDPTARLLQLKQENIQLNATLKTVEDQLVALRKRQALISQLKDLKDQSEAYPVFGKTIAEVEAEQLALKKLSDAWGAYRYRKTDYETQKSKKDLVEAELKGLGYPEILSQDFSVEIAQTSKELSVVEEDRTLLIKHKSLLEKVSDIRPEIVLKEEHEALQIDVEFNRERSQKISELLGEYSSQRKIILQLEETKADLQKQLEPTEELQNNLHIMEAMVKFFSPAGFKLFELRKRCEFLIERANFWSPVFFQEQHEWSLPDDLDSIDFLVQPVKHRRTEPFPASQLSAGEENRAERVLLFSQLEMTPPSKALNVLFLDEIEGHLDSVGRTVFTEVVVPKLKETFQDRAITIISHEDSLRRSQDIDHLWLAERQNRKTRLSITENYNRRMEL